MFYRFVLASRLVTADVLGRITAEPDKSSLWRNGVPLDRSSEGGGERAARFTALPVPAQGLGVAANPGYFLGRYTPGVLSPA